MPLFAFFEGKNSTCVHLFVTGVLFKFHSVPRSLDLPQSHILFLVVDES